MVEDLLVARGIIVSHQTVRLWAEKFGRTFANELTTDSVTWRTDAPVRIAGVRPGFRYLRKGATYRPPRQFSYNEKWRSPASNLP